ncbi:MAG TPA: TIGR02302 family protein, partial [Rhizobiaceae bacterium]|nr:TIGR02302 family protein [Rhizobiaceae bacterium]
MRTPSSSPARSSSGASPTASSSAGIASGGAPKAAQRLAGIRLWSAVLIGLERFAGRVLPLIVVVALFAIVSWFGLFRIVPDWARIGIGALFALAALAMLLPLFGVRMPKRLETDKRLEADNRLSHRPISTQDEALARSDDPFARALWAEHQRRMATQIIGVEAIRPRTDIPRRDPFGLRAVVALLLVTAFAYSHAPAGGRLDDVARAHNMTPVTPPRIDAWVTPPAYTRAAPIFLTAEANLARTDFAIPAGSIATVRIIGGSGAEQVAYAGVVAPGPEASAGGGGAPRQASQREATRRFDITIAEGGRLEIRDGEAALGDWSFAVTPDRAPTIALKQPPQRALNGTLTLEYTVDDDYGVSAADAQIERAGNPGEDARPLYDAPEIALGVSRRSGPVDGKTSRNLAEHPWAGAEVEMVLQAHDDAGQTGHSAPAALVLPQRPFANPLARAIIEQRRNLALDANAARDVRMVLDIITLHPETTIKNASHFLGIRIAVAMLDTARNDDDLRGVVDYLWELALGIDGGNLSEAEKRLQQAAEALREALKNGASDEEIERLMAELREAMQEMMRELAEQAARNPDMAQQMPQGDFSQMEMRDLDRMLDDIEEMAKSGARDKAEQLLSELQDMMNNMQMGRHNQQQGD